MTSLSTNQAEEEGENRPMTAEIDLFNEKE